MDAVTHDRRAIRFLLLLHRRRYVTGSNCWPRNQSDGLSHPVRDVNFITHQVLRDGDELGTNQMVAVTL